MRKNVAGQVIAAEMVSVDDGSAFTGTVTVYITGDGGAQAIGTVGSGVCTHEGNGLHTYQPSQAETNYTHIAFTFVGTGAVPVTIQVYTNVDQQLVDIQSSVSSIETKVDTLLARITSTLFSGITYLSRWLGAIAGKTADTSTRAEINATTAGTSYNETTDSLEAVRDRGDAAWITGSSSDTGARTITITVNDGTNPLQGAKVRVRQGSENYVKETNASGVVTFNLDDFTWNVAITKPQYEFTATTLVVNGSTSPPTYSMTLVSLTPSDADKVTGYWTVLGENGEPKEGVVVTVRAIKAKSGSVGLIHVKTARTETTDSEGIAEFANMLPGWSYSVSLDGETIATVAIASDATDEVELGSCILAE